MRRCRHTALTRLSGVARVFNGTLLAVGGKVGRRSDPPGKADFNGPPHTPFTNPGHRADLAGGVVLYTARSSASHPIRRTWGFRFL